MPARGVTLLELTITLVIVSLMLLFVTPLASDFMQRNQLSVATNNLLAVINYSRNQALVLGKNLLLTPFYKNDWSQGMMLFEGDQLLQVWQWPNATIKINWNGFASDQYLQFPGNGINGAMNGTFNLCVAHLNKAVVINRLGRARVADSSSGCP